MSQPERRPAPSLPTSGVEESNKEGGSKRLGGRMTKDESRRGGREMANNEDSEHDEKEDAPLERWSLGILNDKKTEEVPGTVLLLSAHRNEPLGMKHAPRNTSASSLPSPYPSSSPSRRSSSIPRQKKTPDGKVILVPQPEESQNDPLNWPEWRRDLALLSLGLYCMIGGGITPLLAAGFQNVADEYGVTVQRVALTTGLYMMGLGLGSVIFSPTAILFGKRPVYLFSAIIWILSAVWCATSPSFGSLIAARIFQGIAVSPVECLPSATIAEIFFLHERAFRIGIYTLLLLGGKNLTPLVSAAIIQAMNWRWVFWILALVVAFGGLLLFIFVPETFWDRTPHRKPKRPGMGRRSISNIFQSKSITVDEPYPKESDTMTPRQQRLHDHNVHVNFTESDTDQVDGSGDRPSLHLNNMPAAAQHSWADRVVPSGQGPTTPTLHNLNSPYYLDIEKKGDYLTHDSQPGLGSSQNSTGYSPPGPLREVPSKTAETTEPPLKSQAVTPANDPEKAASRMASDPDRKLTPMRYTQNLRQSPKQSFVQTMRPYNGRQSHANWFLVAIRPFILYTYPAIFWSSCVYACSVGWLIVLSECVSTVYRNSETYNFTPLQVGLVYISPFVGGVLGTAVAGRVSDVVVRYMSGRNGGVYEPEFRLIMGVPIMISTTIGLMGFGWSVQEHDAWIVPTVFFGIISFGCSLGSTTAITFAVDSYRQYAGEALVTLNFTKNVLHGLVWSLFFPNWLEADGPKTVFLVIGGLQIALCLLSIPTYIYGKRARMWTVRRNAMERFS